MADSHNIRLLEILKSIFEDVEKHFSQVLLKNAKSCTACMCWSAQHKGTHAAKPQLARLCFMQIPIGAEDGFEGVVDLVRMKGITWDGEVSLSSGPQSHCNLVLCAKVACAKVIAPCSQTLSTVQRCLQGHTQICY